MDLVERDLFTLVGLASFLSYDLMVDVSGQLNRYLLYFEDGLISNLRVKVQNF